MSTTNQGCGAHAGSDTPSIMFYSHDSYGLGHLRRTLAIAHYLRAYLPWLSQLIVTGSPVAHGFPIPEGADYVKLPSVVKVGEGKFESRSLSAPFLKTLAVRGDILLSTARHLEPDVLLVDHTPAGLKGEIVPTLRHLKAHSPHTRLILGLRDIIDDAPKVRQSWAHEGVYELLDDVYDLILIYGYRDMYDVVREYGLSSRAARKTRYVGYLRREASRSAEEVRRDLDLKTGRLVVVTAGGGGDGRDLLCAMLEALRGSSVPLGFDSLFITGPLMPEDHREQLRALVDGRHSVRFLDVVWDLTNYIGAADAVVSMGGHNSVSEILSFNRPALICPRVAPRREQFRRAEALSERGLVRMIHPDDLAPGRLLAEVEILLANPAPRTARLAMEGLPAIGAALGAALPTRRSFRASRWYAPAVAP
jgi:predicted glycosyltransferase